MERTVARGEGRVGLDLDPVRDVELEVVGGEVMVAGTPGPGRLEVECVAGPPVTVDWDRGRLRVRHLPAAGFDLHSPRALVTVSCGPHATVRTAAVSAATTVAGIAGSVSSSSVSGAVTWGFVSGDLSARTVSGRLDMEGVVGRLRVRTVSGPVGVAGGALEELSLVSTSGDAIVGLDARSGCSYRLRSVSGDLAVAVPAGTDLTVEASSVSGGIDLPAPVSGGRRRRGTVIGSGDGCMRLNSVSGRLTVLVRDAALTA